MATFLWSFIAFACGSLPFSVWVGRLLLGKEITRYGDTNPGATNVFRAGGRSAAGRRAGILAVLLDIAKGTLPVALATAGAGLSGAALWPVAWAPIAGHAFSPWLGWKGGKAVATTCGVWMALTAWEFPTIGGLLLLFFFKLIDSSGWAVMLATALTFGWLLLTPPAWNLLGLRPAPADLFVMAVGTLLLLGWVHRHDLMHLPRLRAATAARKSP